MIGQMAIAIAFPGFNYLGRTATPIFLLIDHFLSTRSLKFLQSARSNSVLFSSSFIDATVSNAF